LDLGVDYSHGAQAALIPEVGDGEGPRAGDLAGRGDPVEFGRVPVEPARVREELLGRDRADRTRTLAPLARTPEACYIDSTGMDVEAVVERMAREVERACSTIS